MHFHDPKCRSPHGVKKEIDVNFFINFFYEKHNYNFIDRMKLLKPCGITKWYFITIIGWPSGEKGNIVSITN